MKKEIKGKVGRPKLADEKLKKESVIVASFLIVTVAIYTFFMLETMKIEYDSKYYVGTIYNTHVNSCVIEKNKIDCGPAVTYMKYKVGNSSYKEMLKEDKSIEVEIDKNKDVKYCYKTNDSKMTCSK